MQFVFAGDAMAQLLLFSILPPSKSSVGRVARARRRVRLFTPLRFLMTAVAICMLLLPVRAQNVGKISGVVKDSETGEALYGCNISIVGTTLGAATDVEGAYFVLNVPPGVYSIQASMIGYQKILQKGVVVNAGRTTGANFMLSSKAIQQQEIVVEAVRPDVEREKTSTSAITRFEDVQQMAGIRDVGDILSLTADVTDGHFRGGRAGEEYYTLQGMGITNPLDNTSAFLPIMSSVEEVEVMTSGFGAQYGNAQSGVVNITMKEGKSDAWRTRVETRMRAPGRKHFGPSVYDPAANDYLAHMFDANLWRYGVNDSAGAYIKYVSNNYYRTDDSTKATHIALARALWQQTKRGINQNYGKNIDYSAEAATGGPVDDGVRMFMAMRTNTTWPVFPTEQPDLQRQVMGNVAVDLPGSSTLRISGGFTQDNENVFPSQFSSASGYEQWLWDRITGTRYRKRSNTQVGVRFTQTLSPSTFYDIKLNSLFTRNRVGSTPFPVSIADSLVQTISWSTGIYALKTGTNQYDRMDAFQGDDVFQNEYTRTISFDGSLTSQVTGAHMLNAGMQFNYYLMDISNSSGHTEPILDKYSGKPFEGALYVQDKMEFEGFIANVGLRLDLWSVNQDFYNNLFLPFQVVADSTGRLINDPDAASKSKTPILGRLQPRVGISFPVSISTVFHLNYGAFMQRPSFQYLIRSRYAQVNTVPDIIGNPRLLPETTNSYDFGVMQGLGEGFTLDVSGYYKDVRNLIQQVIYHTVADVRTFANLDYADIRGFRLALTKRRGSLTGSINYHYSVATGKSASVTNSPPQYNLNTATGQVTTDLLTYQVPVRDIVLDFDRTHNFILNLGYQTDSEWGPVLFDSHPFENLTLSTNSFFRSGRPYTSSATAADAKLKNGARAPAEYNTNLRLTKKIQHFFGTTASVYMEIFNLFDQKILNYDYVFPPFNPTEKNPQTHAYETFPIDDLQNGIRYWNDPASQKFAADQSFLIYSNQPRSFNFGLVIEL
jgi:hypothetical protein